MILEQVSSHRYDIRAGWFFSFPYFLLFFPYSDRFFLLIAGVEVIVLDHTQ
jgi:hypothetical protein